MGPKSMVIMVPETDSNEQVCSGFSRLPKSIQVSALAGHFDHHGRPPPFSLLCKNFSYEETKVGPELSEIYVLGSY